MTDTILRDHLLRLLEWQDAHATYDAAVADLPAELRAVRPEGLPYSPWQLLEHLRLTQRDILEFCRSAAYEELKWPEEYWPASAGPSAAEDWERSIRGFHADLEALKKLVADPTTDLFGEVPAGTGQTLLREVLLAADHNAYHVGQLVVVRRVLGAWPAA